MFGAGAWRRVLMVVVVLGACGAEPEAAGDERAAAATTTVSPPGFGTREATSVSYDAQERVRADIGCLPDLDAETLDAAFAERLGPLIGWDNPRVYTLGENRWLWLAHDSYFDYPWNASGLKDNGPQIQNLAMLQEGTCFTLIHGGRPDNRLSFEVGDESNGQEYDSKRFFWPLGGEVDGDVLRVFWSEMHRSHPRPEPTDGLTRHPEKVWLAEYDLDTLERRSFDRAPNSGVFPSWGFAVASDDEYSYMFGNSNLLNYEREGGYWDGPHSATNVFLARVPRGQLGAAPSYRTADGWSDDPDDTAEISQRFWAENLMQPVYLHGRWISVVKRDGFSGTQVIIDVADRSWGPWTTVDEFTYEPRPASVDKNSYAPVILPWSNPDDGLAVVIAENAFHWPSAVADPPVYRPAVFTRPWPS